MEFDRFTVALLVRRSDAPVLDEEAAAALQDAHMAYLSDLHDAGHLLAAGPVRNDEIAGLSILRVPPEEARALKEADPAVQAGCYTVTVAEWLVPGGRSVSRRSTCHARSPKPSAETVESRRRRWRLANRFDGFSV